MDKVFIDTDIARDLLSERHPHYQASAQLFTLADKGKIKIYTSAVSFNNLNYLLTRQYNANESRRILSSFRILVKVLAVDEKVIDLALTSKFADFEDALQYFTAVENQISILLTRNIKDYKQAQISIMSADQYINSL
jgi:predicted nucleic acid-binding protein